MVQKFTRCPGSAVVKETLIKTTRRCCFAPDREASIEREIKFGGPQDGSAPKGTCHQV